MRWTPGGTSDDIEDRRDDGGGGGGFGFGGMHIGIGGMIILLILSFVFKRNFFALLGGGGVLYTAGSLLYNRNRPQTLGPLGDHEVWHLLVLGGSVAHAVFIVVYVL